MRTGKKKGLFEELVLIHGVAGFAFTIVAEVPEGEPLYLAEQKWIDSLNPTLNISKVARNSMLDPAVAKSAGRQGERHREARHTTEEYLLIAKALVENPASTARQVFGILSDQGLCTELSIVESIKSQDKHRWIETRSPSLWKELTKLREAGLARKYRVRRLKAPDGTIHEFYNMSAFSKEQGLSQPKVSEVVNGKRRQHKGWTAPDGE